MTSFAAVRSPFPRAPLLALVACLAAWGCSKSDGAATPNASDASLEVAPTDDPTAEIGGFDIQLVPEVPATAQTAAVPAQAAFLGGIRSGATPVLKSWTVTASEGPCRLEEPRIPFCSPQCVETVCTPGGCVRETDPRSAGTLTLNGIMVEGGGTTLTLPPEAPSFVYLLPSNVRLAYPPAPPGAEVVLSGQGGHLGTFTLRGRGITPLVIPAGGVPVVRPGMPFVVRWTPGTAAEQARVQLLLDLSFHAGTKGSITCDLPDSGSLEISGAMMTKLLALGTAGFPKVVLTRSNIATADLPRGRVKLSIFCELPSTLMIEGQTSCTGDADCPSGQTCAPSLLCR